MQHSILLNDKRAMSNGAVVAIMLIAFIMVGAAIFLYVPGLSTSNPKLPGASNGMVNTYLPIQFYIADKLAGTAQQGVITVYNTTTNTQIWTGTASSSGSVTTTGVSFASGQKVNIEVTLSNYVSQWFDNVVVPQIPSSIQATATSISLTELITHIGSWTLAITDQYGNTFTSTKDILNFTSSSCVDSTTNVCVSGSSDAVTVTLYEATANAGWASSTDPITGNVWNVVNEMVRNGSTMTITGGGTQHVSGSSTYYLTQFSDSTLTQQTIGSTTTGGVAAITFTIGKGSLVQGAGETLKISPQQYFDITGFTNGSPSSSAVGLNGVTALTLSVVTHS